MLRAILVYVQLDIPSSAMWIFKLIVLYHMIPFSIRFLFLLLPYSSHFFSFLQSAASMEGLASLRVPFQTTQFHSSRPRTSILPSQAIFFHKRSSFSSFSASAQVRFFLYHFATFYRVFLCINMGLSRFFVLGVGG